MAELHPHPGDAAARRGYRATEPAQALYYGRWLLLLIAALLMLAFVRSAMTPTNKLAGLGILTGVCITVATSGWWLGSQVRLKDDMTRTVVTGLLTNVYRAFDFREESDVYDVLERSVDGELLRDVYLEMRRGLVLASQGGASAKVKDVELVKLEAQPAEDRGHRARATWQVRAAVGHWGHIHERRNEYQAKLTLQPIDGAWKLVDVEILDESGSALQKSRVVRTPRRFRGPTPALTAYFPAPSPLETRPCACCN